MFCWHEIIKENWLLSFLLSKPDLVLIKDKGEITDMDCQSA